MFDLILLISTAVTLPYLMCGINPAIIVTRALTGGDIRKLGSGNAGLTNTIRSVGKHAGVAVLLLDLLKGFAAVWLVRLCGYYVLSLNISDPASGLFYINYIAAAAAAVGHAFPVWYSFRGGKSVLVTLAVTLTIQWQAGLVLFALFLLIMFVSGYVSLGSVIAGSLYPFGVLAVTHYIYSSASLWLDFVFAAVVAAVLVVKHKDNIARLRAHTEKKMLHKKK